MVAVTFALPAESSDFIRLLTETVSERCNGVNNTRGQIHGRSVAVFHTGVGEKSCQSWIEKSLNDRRFNYLISAGFAGALGRELQVGDLLLSQNFSSAELLQSPHLDHTGQGLHVGTLATAQKVIASNSERERYAQETGAVAVDMETEFIAAACATRRIPLLSLRVISDTPTESLPAPPEILFDLDRQRTSLTRLTAYLATHPGALKRLGVFRHQIVRARRRLTEALDRIMRVDLI